MTLLIYDCDGVLVDSEVLASESLAELMTTLGQTMTAAECAQVFGGRSVKDVLTRANEILGRPIPDDMGKEAAQRLLTRFRQELKPIAGAAATVASLPYPRCVSSSSTPERLRLSLEVTGLAPLFGANVFSAAQVANGKPAPDLFLFAARHLGEHPSGAIVIEDSVPGIEAARAAGMASIGFAGASHVAADLPARLMAAGADLVVTAMAEVPSAVAELIDRGGKRMSRRP
jgi:HAD superfamily hydrolase (TIGR01509 family)